MALDTTAILAALRDFPDPETGRGIIQLEQVSQIEVSGSKVKLTLGLTTHSKPLWAETQQQLAETLKAKLPGVEQVEINIQTHERKPEKLGQIGLSAKSVVAVGSGKGGVGKSTIAASIALGLQRAGCTVGLLDADVYGPSIPHLLGLSGRPEVRDGRVTPISAAGMNVMSMGFMIPPGEAVVWRGPMLHGAISQMLGQTDWGDLDYLIIDMPPGTGDIAISLSQVLPLTGAVVVCTPQDVALLDAVKAISMFGKVNIPVLGLVENMSFFKCPDCGSQHDIFGHGGAKKRALDMGVPFLGEVPININIRIRGDAGQTNANFEDAASSEYLQAICHNLARNIADAHREKPALPSLSVL
jgi:ATP-binding protein involved in chromosome partitioning